MASQIVGLANRENVSRCGPKSLKNEKLVSGWDVICNTRCNIVVKSADPVCELQKAKENWVAGVALLRKGEEGGGVYMLVPGVIVGLCLFGFLGVPTPTLDRRHKPPSLSKSSRHECECGVFACIHGSALAIATGMHWPAPWVRWPSPPFTTAHHGARPSPRLTTALQDTGASRPWPAAKASVKHVSAKHLGTGRESCMQCGDVACVSKRHGTGGGGWAAATTNGRWMASRNGWQVGMSG